LLVAVAGGPRTNLTSARGLHRLDRQPSPVRPALSKARWELTHSATKLSSTRATTNDKSYSMDLNVTGSRVARHLKDSGTSVLASSVPEKGLAPFLSEGIAANVQIPPERHLPLRTVRAEGPAVSAQPMAEFPF
jgi:hypothetical protein